MHRNARYMEPIQLDYQSRAGITVQPVYVSLHLVLEEESWLTVLKEQGSYLLLFHTL